ncbi:hypothetical protein [Pantoea sp.]|uniref:hypothetical protein n=1 Tax=Pantoea sp. TaxID=69393 RepID=UPI0031E293C1
MAKRACSVIGKIVLFAVVMLTVAKGVPYQGLVESIKRLFDFQRANKVTAFLLGEPDVEVWASLSDYLSILINIFISVPVMSAIITAHNVMTHNASSSGVLREWGMSTLRRFGKIFGFIFLFWALFRLFPYPEVFSEQSHSTFTLVAILAFQVLLTSVCYGFITKTMTIKRSA